MRGNAEAGVGLELTLERQVVDLEALVRTLRSGDDGGVADQGVVNARVGHQVRLELVQVDVEGAVEAQRRGDGTDDLGNQTVQVLVVGALDAQVTPADIVDGLVIDKEGAVRVLDSAVGREDSVVGLDDGSRDLRRRVNGELELTLLAVISRQALEEQGAEAGTSTATERVED